APLTDLTKKGAFTWSPQVQECFDRFKVIMTSCSVLALPDFMKSFDLFYDPSEEAICAILMQERHPIAFKSRKLRGPERFYSIYNKH
ncbi:ribonuclease H family protein, partial [Escherichia coli]|uniref:ribonuclease H family protein n=1 Tax=Escherichia coli TaxID=562 RepID=UPI00215B3DDA